MASRIKIYKLPHGIEQLYNDDADLFMGWLWFCSVRWKENGAKKVWATVDQQWFPVSHFKVVQLFFAIFFFSMTFYKEDRWGDLTAPQFPSYLVFAEHFFGLLAVESSKLDQPMWNVKIRCMGSGMTTIDGSGKVGRPLANITYRNDAISSFQNIFRD